MTSSAPRSRTSWAFSARHTRHVRAHCLGNLDRERPDAAGRTDDQHPLAGLEPARIAQAMERRTTGGGDRRCVRPVERGRLPNQLVLPCPREFSGRAGALAEHLVADREPRDPAADGLDRARQVEARDAVRRPPEPCRCAHEQRRPQIAKTSPMCTAAAWTRTSTSRSPMVGGSMSRRSSDSIGP